MKPGVTVMRSQSMTCVLRPARLRMSALLPMAMKRPSLTANASARGRLSSMVRTLPLTTMRSGPASVLVLPASVCAPARTGAASKAPKPKASRRLSFDISATPYFLVHAQPVLAEHLAHVRRAPAAVQQALRHLGQLDDRFEAFHHVPGPIAVDVRRPTLAIHSHDLLIVPSRHEVRAEADVIDADQLLQVVEMLEELVHRRLRRGLDVRVLRAAHEEVADRREPDDAARTRDRLDESVGNVARVVVQGARVRVRTDDGHALGYLDRV